MAEWLLTIWFTIIPTDTMEPKEFSFSTSYDSYEECVIEEDKFNVVVIDKRTSFHKVTITDQVHKDLTDGFVSKIQYIVLNSLNHLNF